ncbi:MAG: hypothetical protein ABR606_14255 [Vicinamibacterales bacterium]
MPQTHRLEILNAVDCARAGFIRAAAVMGWCAAIARIHRTVEKIGFQAKRPFIDRITDIALGRSKR